MEEYVLSIFSSSSSLPTEGDISSHDFFPPPPFLIPVTFWKESPTLLQT
jgi:hypothetical protein